MHNVVSFSGGRTSAYLVYLIEEKRKLGLLDNTHYVFMDTGAEHPKTYEFIRNCVKYLGIEITCLRVKVNPKHGVGASYQVVPLKNCKPDLQPWYDYTQKYGMAHVTMPKCTDVMKINPFTKYCNDTFGKGNYITWLGIRTDEPKRIKEIDGIKYLAEISDKDKADILDWWAGRPFDLDLPEWLGNCVFCIKKGAPRIALAQIDEPQLAEDWESMVYRSGMYVTAGRKEKGIANEACYRNYQTFKGIRTAFKNQTRKDIVARQRSSSGGCTESCEVATLQMELFDE